MCLCVILYLSLCRPPGSDAVGCAIFFLMLSIYVWDPVTFFFFGDAVIPQQHSPAAVALGSSAIPPRSAHAEHAVGDIRIGHNIIFLILHPC